MALETRINIFIYYDYFQGLSVCVDMYVEVRGGWQLSSSTALHLIVRDKVSPLNGKLSISGRLAGQQAPGIHLCLFYWKVQDVGSRGPLRWIWWVRRLLLRPWKDRLWHGQGSKKSSDQRNKDPQNRSGRVFFFWDKNGCRAEACSQALWFPDKRQGRERGEWCVSSNTTFEVKSFP